MFLIQHSSRSKLRLLTLGNLMRVLHGSERPLIIHFIGHGISDEGDTKLILEDDVGLDQPVSVAEFKRILPSTLGPPCRLAVLNACHSHGFATALINSGVEHVVAVNADDAILDITARHFAAQFYYFLLLGCFNVSDLFEIACKSILNNESLKNAFSYQYGTSLNWEEHLKFQLLPFDGIHDEPLDYEYVIGDVITPIWQNTNLRRVSPDPFEGRQKELQGIANYLHSHSNYRCIAIQGMGGMGKTVLAIAVGRWHHERSRYKNGVWLAELRSASRATEARKRIASAMGLPEDVTSEGKLHLRLADQNALLILDDMDNLIKNDADGTIHLLNSLLSCPRLRILTTSRLELPGNINYQRFQLSRLSPEFTLSIFQKYAPPHDMWRHNEGNYIEDLNWLIKLFDGYPFPIRLAATYMKQVRCSLNELRNRLDTDPLNVYVLRRLPPSRDTSLAITLNLSYHSLPPLAKHILTVLSLFPAGLTDNAAKQIIGDEKIRSLELLLQYSMAEEYDLGGPQRIGLPEPAREYVVSLIDDEENLYRQYFPAAINYFYRLSEEKYNEFTYELSAESASDVLLKEQPNILHHLKWGYRQNPVKIMFVYALEQLRNFGGLRTRDSLTLLCKIWGWPEILPKGWVI